MKKENAVITNGCSPDNISGSACDRTNQWYRLSKDNKKLAKSWAKKLTVNEDTCIAELCVKFADYFGFSIDSAALAEAFRLAGKKVVLVERHFGNRLLCSYVVGGR